MLRATQRNISNVLGVHRKKVTNMRKTKLENGFKIEGFLPRIAIEDLMQNFHVYFKDGKLVVITKGRLSISNRV